MTAMQPMRILCVEDNPVNWRLVQRLLTQAGYEMHWAEEGLRGYELALELKPALVLLDINLPGLSGFEVATKLRQNPDLAGMPIVALTAKTLKSDRETALVAGCDGFISKPIDPFQFVGQVEAYLQGQRDKVEQGREGLALRQFSQQVVDHLESQLKEAQEANRKLTEAQDALERRNRSLSRLLALSQSIVSMHSAGGLLDRILGQVQAEFGALKVCGYRFHSEGGFWEGLQWNGSAFETAPPIHSQHPFISKLPKGPADPAYFGEKLVHSPFWEEGLGAGFWTQPSASVLLLLPHRQKEGVLWGFWTLSREASKPFLAYEVELVALHAGIAQVSLENAELIANLNESSRALAASYDHLESAYSDLQNAQMALSQRERQALLGDLFLKMAQRLQVPVASLHKQSLTFDRLLEPMDSASHTRLWREETPKAVAEVREAVSKIDAFLKALNRRASKQVVATPEWVDLHDLVQQEIELLEAEGILSQGLSINLDLKASLPLIFGVYDDFAETFSRLVQQALSGPTPSASLGVRSWNEEEMFTLEIQDQGGPIPADELAKAFEPFQRLNEAAGGEVRMPVEGLTACNQFMSAYHGLLELRNEGSGLVSRLRLPLR